MPAPTALLQPEAQPEAAPMPVVDNDEILLDASAVALPEGSVELQPTITTDTEMVIDEEGRPRFAPAKDVVRPPNSTLSTTILTLPRIPLSAVSSARCPFRRTA